MTCLIDVTVVDPLAPSYFQGVAKSLTPGLTAQQAEQKKKNKYDALARAQHCTFFPFAVETLGTFGAGAAKFLRILATHREGRSHNATVPRARHHQQHRSCSAEAQCCVPAEDAEHAKE